MKIAILDPASGIAGDMFLGALVDVGLDKAWLERLPSTLGLSGVEVRITDVQRSHVHCVKVDFDIPPQPHGRAVSEIHRLIDAVKIPEKVARSAHAAFEGIAAIESAIHGVAPDELHLHAYDLTVDLVPNQSADLTFLAKITGVFEVELEKRKVIERARERVLTWQVSPDLEPVRIFVCGA